MNRCIELRSELERINQGQTRDYCAEQKGKCCSFMIPVTVEDEKLISSAIKNNKISPSLLSIAKERSSSMTETRCVFLTEIGCGVSVKYRPMICRAWNLGTDHSCGECKISSLRNNRKIDSADEKVVEEAIEYIDDRTSNMLPSLVRRALKQIESF